MKALILLAALTVVIGQAKPQSLEELLDLNLADEPITETVTTTFKSVQLINSHTTKMPANKQLIFLISHRFGYLDSGFPDLFGLDNATVRFGFEYGINQKLALGLGRGTYKRNYDFFAKYALLEQTTGAKEFPFTLTLLGVANISSARLPEGRDYLFAHRMGYSTQLLISRKFSETISIQLMPTYVHHNMVQNANQQNDVFAIGIGGRAKLNNWVAFTYEYQYPFLNRSHDVSQPLSLGFDIETGGHVFQLFITNASAIYDAAYITETTDKWLNGKVRFGFNISRTF